MAESLLEVLGLASWYGPTQAVFDVSLSVGAGERVALLGRNGAGKTTTFLSLMGIDVRSSGHVAFDGRPILGQRTEDVARAGIGWVPDTRRIFASLTVRQNLELAVAGRREDGDELDQVLEIFPALVNLLDREGGHLSGGEQQMLAIARALAMKPRLLLLDEPTEGLAPVVVDSLLASLRAMSATSDVAVLLAEQSMSFALESCDRVVVLDVGRTVFDGDIEHLRGDRTGWQDFLLGVSDAPPGSDVGREA